MSIEERQGHDRPREDAPAGSDLEEVERGEKAEKGSMAEEVERAAEREDEAAEG